MKTEEMVESGSSRLILLALVVAVFSTTVIDIIIPLFLVDIAKTFHVSAAVASQIRTYSSIAQIIPGLLLGFLSVRYKAKSLLIIGALCISLAAIGSYAAFDLNYMQFFYSFNGIGSVIVSAMALVVIGEFYPLQRKPHAVGIISATGALGYVIGAPVSALISDYAGWRSTFTYLVLPISIAAVILALYLIPSSNPIRPVTVKKEPYWGGFQEIFMNKSAIACLISFIFFLILFSIGTFGIAFFRTTFNISADFASVIMFGGALSGALGSLVSGQFVIKFGRKNLTVVASLLSAILAMIAFYMPSIWIVLGFRYSSMIFWGVAIAANANLMLEQVPKHRGSMMSLRVAFAGIGSAVGVAIGGIVLSLYDYQTIALILGTLGIVGSFILLAAARDPCKPLTLEQNERDKL